MELISANAEPEKVKSRRARTVDEVIGEKRFPARRFFWSYFLLSKNLNQGCKLKSV